MTEPDTDASGYAVVSVTDGDTLVVEVAGIEERLRLVGINSPESDECYASEAAAGLASLLEGQMVRLEADQSDRDQYGRLLRYVYLEDLFVNEWLVEQGLAIARRYPPDTAMADTLDAAQDRAEAGSRGLWAAEACGTAASGAISLGTIRDDADGNDNHNLNDEWVELVNEGDADLDLTGWSVKDESASHRYSFPNGFTFGPGRTVRLHTGCGADSDDSLYWCNQGSAIWNNDGDTVFVIDPSGNVATSLSY